MIAMLIATAFFLVSIGAGYGDGMDGAVGDGAFILTLVGFFVLTVGGWLGGAIVFTYGMRVLNLVEEPASRATSPIPQPEEEAAENVATRRARPSDALERALRLCADRGCRRLAVLEEDHRRDRDDPVALGQLALLVDVDLDELQLAVALLDDPVEHGRDGVARAAPLGPEVDDHRRLALEHLLREGVFLHCGCHSDVPFAG